MARVGRLIGLAAGIAVLIGASAPSPRIGLSGEETIETGR